MTQQTQHPIPVFMPPADCAWSVRKVRAFTTNRGVGAFAEVTFNGLHVADFEDDGNGGFPFLRWRVPARPELKQLTDALPPQELVPGLTHHFTEETFIEALVNIALAEKDLNRLLKRIVVLGADGKLRSYPAHFAPTPVNLLAALDKNPNGKVLNQMPRPEALRVYLAAIAA